MLFLFNDAVFDIGDPRETALEAGTGHGFTDETLLKMRVGKAAKLVREAVFDEPQIARTNPEVASFLAALMAWKTDEANAMLAVASRHIQLASQVQLRLASVSLVTVQQLRELQSAGKLSSHVANISVWSQAPARLKA
ncbi:MAG: hypothetical protein RKE49_08525 [Oceanicaulis sp.]